jgi:hypothetical protein
MSSNLIQEFRFSLPLDNGLLIADVKNGRPIAERDILDLAINARALFVLSTLACRELGGIQACFDLWMETQELFSKLCSSWSGVMTDPLPQVHWLVAELARLRELSTDRHSLYTSSEQQRLQHVEIRGDVDFEDTFNQRHALEPKGEHNSTPAHIYRVALPHR